MNRKKMNVKLLSNMCIKSQWMLSNANISHFVFYFVFSMPCGVFVVT